MTRRYGLSERATRSFREIAEYLRNRYGADRGRRYMQDLLATCGRLARGVEQHRSCRETFADDLREDLRFARSGRHYIVFVFTPQGILVADILHQSSDLAGKLGRLT